MNRIQIICIALLFGLSGCNGELKNEPVPVVSQDREFDKVKLSDLKGRPINLDQYKEKTVFINFWATWCKPCIQEMPSIESIKNKLQQNGVVFLVASNESVEEITGFRNAHTYSLDFVRIENSEELGIQSLPTTYIFNAAGKLVFSESGYRKWDDQENIDIIQKIVNSNE